MPLGTKVLTSCLRNVLRRKDTRELDPKSKESPGATRAMVQFERVCFVHNSLRYDGTRRKVYTLCTLIKRIQVHTAHVSKCDTAQTSA